MRTDLSLSDQTMKDREVARRLGMRGMLTQNGCGLPGEVGSW